MATTKSFFAWKNNKGKSNLVKYSCKLAHYLETESFSLSCVSVKLGKLWAFINFLTVGYGKEPSKCRWRSIKFFII